MLQSMIGIGAKLNAVINNRFRTDTNAAALGVSHDGTWYQADGSGGFVSGSGGVVTSSGSGNTADDYVNGFALHGDIAGAAWDLTQLRAGGNTAASFTAAFVDVKVQEIVNQPVPEPATFGLLGLGLAARRRKTA